MTAPAHLRFTRLNAFTADDIAIVGAPEGALSGLTFAAKDVFDIAGHVTGAGNPDWRRTHQPASANAPVVDQLVAAGATLIGRTLTEELAFSIVGENAHYGTPLNSAAPDRVPGGSSSGSAAAVAGGAVDFAIGTDTAGSIRVPAAFCGLFGLRPTTGALSSDGIVPLAPGFDVPGWFARDAGTLRRVGEVLLPEAASPTVATLGVLATAAAIADPAVAAAFEAMLAALRPHTGIRLIGAEFDLPGWTAAFRVLQGRVAWQTHGAWITATGPSFGPGIAERFAWTSRITDDQVGVAETVIAAARRQIFDLFGTVDALCLPTTPMPPPPRHSAGPVLEDLRTRVLQLTAPASFAGLPQLSLPMGEVDFAPVGFSIIGAPGADRALLDWAAGLADFPPPVDADA